MWGRIRDILALLFFGYTSTERRCRVLEADLSSLLEKINMMVAREAKRQSRAAHEVIDHLGQGTPAPASRKAELRSRVFGHLKPHPTFDHPDQLPLDEESPDESRNRSSKAAG